MSHEVLPPSQAPSSAELLERLARDMAEIDRAFGPRTGRISPIDGCRRCCFDQADLDMLVGPPDRIDDATFFRAMFSWGSTLDPSVEWLRWVAPRLLRAVIEGPPSLDDEMVAVRLGAAGWRGWPAAERQAVEALCATWWNAALVGPVDEWSASGALSFLVPLTGGIRPWLEIWSVTPGRSADLQVRELWQDWGQAIGAGELDVAVSTTGPNIAPELAQWLRRHGARRLADGDLDEASAASLARLVAGTGGVATQGPPSRVEEVAGQSTARW